MGDDSAEIFFQSLGVHREQFRHGQERLFLDVVDLAFPLQTVLQGTTEGGATPRSAEECKALQSSTDSHTPKVSWSTSLPEMMGNLWGCPQDLKKTADFLQSSGLQIQTA